MRKLIVEEWISLDGYAADKNGQLDFFPSTEANKYSDEDQLKFMDSIDTILLGSLPTSFLLISGLLLLPIQRLLPRN